MLRSSTEGLPGRVVEGSCWVEDEAGWTSQMVPGTMLMLRSLARAWYLAR